MFASLQDFQFLIDSNVRIMTLTHESLIEHPQVRASDKLENLPYIWMIGNLSAPFTSVESINTVYDVSSFNLWQMYKEITDK